MVSFKPLPVLIHPFCYFDWPGTGGTNTWSNRTHAYVEGSCAESTVVINSFVGEDVAAAEDVVICHSSLSGAWTIEKNASIFGVDDSLLETSQAVTIQSGMVLHQYRVAAPSSTDSESPVSQFVWTVYGSGDSFEKGDTTDTSVPSGTFCNLPWSDFFERTKISPDELWSPGEARIAATASAAQMILSLLLFKVTPNNRVLGCVLHHHPRSRCYRENAKYI